MTYNRKNYIQIRDDNGKKVCLTPGQHSEITGKSAQHIGIDYKNKKRLGITNRQAAGYDPMPFKAELLTVKDAVIKNFLTKRRLA